MSELFSYTIVHVKLSISLPIKKNRLRQLHYLRSFVFYDYEYEFKNKMSPCSWLVHDHFLSVLDGQAWITFSSHLWTNQYSLPTHIHTSVCIWHNQSCFIAIYDFFFSKEGTSLHLILNLVFSVKFKTLWMTDCMWHHQHASSCVQIIEEGRKYVKRIFLMIFLLLIVWRNKFIKCRVFSSFSMNEHNWIFDFYFMISWNAFCPRRILQIET